MIERRPQYRREDYPVVISLIVSLGMILAAAVGVWL